jgi:hypothetical protein
VVPHALGSVGVDVEATGKAVVQARDAQAGTVAEAGAENVGDDIDSG